MRTIKALIPLIVTSVLQADMMPKMFDFNATKQHKQDIQKRIRYYKSYEDADKNVTPQQLNPSKKPDREKLQNPAQWREYFMRQSTMRYDSKGVGNIEAIFSSGKLKNMYSKAKGSSVSDIATDKLKATGDRSILAAKEFQESLRGNLFVNSIDDVGSYHSKEDVEKECTIARNFQGTLGYRCLLPSGNKGGFYDTASASLKDAFYACMNDCYESKHCVVVNDQDRAKYITIRKKSLTLQNKKLTKIPIHRGIIKISFEANLTKNKNSFLTLFIEANETNVSVYDHMPFAYSDEGNFSVDIKVSYAKSVNLMVETNESNATIDNLTILALDQIPLYNCPYASVMGDTKEGYFTSKAECDSSCVVQGRCVQELPDIIDLTDNSIVNKCVDVVAKYGGCRLKEERVDYGNGVLVKTVDNYALVPGTIRPRIYSAHDDNLTKRIIQETKDNAYKNMNKLKTYDVVEYPFLFDSNASYGYKAVARPVKKVDLYGHQPIGIDLLVKPKRFDARSGKTFKLYGLLEVVVDYKDPSLNRFVRDKIYYILKNDHEAMPFRRVVKYAQIDIKEYVPGYGEVIEDENLTEPDITFLGTAREKKETFRLYPDGTGEWIPFTETDATPYALWQGKFEGNHYIWEIKFIDKLGDFLAPTDEAAKNLPGIYRRMDEYFKKYYTGERGTGGQAIVKLRAYAYYIPSNQKITFDELLQKAVAFWESGNEEAYPREPEDDSLIKKDGIKIYINGKPNKASAYAVIKVKKEFVGKPGFIFVFMGE